MTEQIEILLRTEKKDEVVELLKLLGEMTQAEQREMFVFIQGMRFAKNSERKEASSILV